MRVLRHLVLVALCAGVLSGFVATLVHQFATVPLILQAEVFEKAQAHVGHDADAADEGWQPADGLQRTVATLLADLLTAIGYGLLLVVALAVRGGSVTWRQGLL